MTIPITDLYYPDDMESAYNEWGANCGPCSLAAVLGEPLSEVRGLFDKFDKLRYCNPTHMQDALAKTAAKYRTGLKVRPKRGLVFVQWGGFETAPIAVQYRHTHWIAVDGIVVFEVNAPHLVSWTNWEEIMPPAMAEEYKRANGTYFIRTAIEVPSRID